MKYLSVVLLALALAACDLGASSPSAQPLPSIGSSSMTPDHSMDMESIEAEPSASAEASSVTGMTCDQAFAELDAVSLSSMNGLDAAIDLLDDTIASCASVTEWQSQLSVLLPNLEMDDAEQFLSERCAENSLIADSAICQAVDM